MVRVPQILILCSSSPINGDCVCCRPLDVVFLTPLGVCSFGFLTDLVERCLKDHTYIKVWVVTNDGLDLTSVLCIPVTFGF